MILRKSCPILISTETIRDIRNTIKLLDRANKRLSVKKSPQKTVYKLEILYKQKLGVSKYLTG